MNWVILIENWVVYPRKLGGLSQKVGISATEMVVEWRYELGYELGSSGTISG